MLIKLTTDKSVTDAAAALQLAVTANHFGVMQVHNLQETMQKKGSGIQPRMFDFRGLSAATSKEGARCQHERLHRFAVPYFDLREGGKTTLATLKPTTLLAMFDSPKVKEVARRWKRRWSRS